MKIRIANDKTGSHSAEYTVENGYAVGKLFYRGVVYTGIEFRSPIIGDHFKVRGVNGTELLFKVVNK